MVRETAQQIALIERNLTDAQMREKAELFVKSGFLPPTIKTVEQALTIIMTGRELGLGLMESLRSINVIQGKPCLSAQLMLALCQRTCELEDMKVEEMAESGKTFGKCTTTIKRKGRSPYVYTFSMDDARALKLDQKDNWIKQAKTMLRWRSLSGNLRVSFADAICGIYTDDEAEDIIADKVEATQVVVEATESATEVLNEAKTMDPGNVHHNIEEMEFVDKISASFLQDPGYAKMAGDRCIGDIVAETTPAGDPKGRKWLAKIAETSKIPDERATLTRYLGLLS
jgi:hypothetical protein